MPPEKIKDFVLYLPPCGIDILLLHVHKLIELYTNRINITLQITKKHIGIFY